MLLCPGCAQGDDGRVHAAPEGWRQLKAPTRQSPASAQLEQGIAGLYHDLLSRGASKLEQLRIPNWMLEDTLPSTFLHRRSQLFTLVGGSAAGSISFREGCVVACDCLPCDDAYGDASWAGRRAHECTRGCAVFHPCSGNTWPPPTPPWQASCRARTWAGPSRPRWQARA